MKPSTPPKSRNKPSTTGKLEETSLQKSKRITAVTTSPALIIKANEENFTIWILMTSRVITVNMDFIENFKNFKLGSWITVGVFPNGYLASISPIPLSVKFHATKSCNDNIMVHSIISDTINSNLRLTAFGRVGIRQTLMPLISKKSKEMPGVWLQWVPNKSRGSSPFRWDWEIIEIDNNTKFDQTELSEVEYRECYEQVRKSKSSEVKPLMNIPIEDSSEKYATRHYGLITNVEEEKNIFSIWSPSLNSSLDHIVIIENELINVPKYDIPIIGQWIMFDTSMSDVEKFQNNRSYKFEISHYLPVSSPCGISSCLFGDHIRVVLNGVLIKSTDMRYIYEIPDFGLVIDKQQSLRSGSIMQLLLERIPFQKRVCEFQWRVLDSSFISKSVIPTSSISPSTVPLREAYTLSKLVLPTTNTMYNSMGDSMNMVDPLFPIQRQSSNTRCNGDLRMHYAPQNDWNLRRKNVHPGLVIELIGIVERIETSRNKGIMWACESHPSGTVVGSQINFNYTEFPGFDIGETVLARFVQRQEPISRYIRWYMVTACRQPPLYKCIADRGRLYICTNARFQMIFDRKGRPVLQANHFAHIIDELNVVSNEMNKLRISPCHMVMEIVMYRRKIQSCIYENKSNGNFQDTAFSWIVSEVSNVRILNDPSSLFKNMSRMANILQTYHKDSTSNKLIVNAVRNGYIHTLTHLSRTSDEQLKETERQVIYNPIPIHA